MRRAGTGFGNIGADKNSKDRQCEDQATHGHSFPDLQSLDVLALRSCVGANTPPACPAAFKSKVKFGFEAKQLLTGTLVPVRNADCCAALHATMTLVAVSGASWRFLPR